MKIKLLDKETCIKRSEMERDTKKIPIILRNHGLPDDIFGKTLDVKYKSEEGQSYKTTDGWFVPFYFVEKIIKGEN